MLEWKGGIHQDCLIFAYCCYGLKVLKVLSDQSYKVLENRKYCTSSGLMHQRDPSGCLFSVLQVPSKAQFV